MTRAVLDAWLAGLDDDFIVAWANRGLLRRGRGLAGQSTAEAVTWDDAETRYHAGFESHTQILTGAGLQHLHCSCPATGACHHAVALLLRAAEFGAATPAPPASGEVPWLSADWASLAAELGRPAVRKALTWLEQGVVIVLETGPSTLVGRVGQTSPQVVHIPVAGGLAASVCSCGQARCAHRAMTVLAARRGAGLDEPADETVSALTADQRNVVQALDAWCRQLALAGSAQASTASLTQGHALVTRARQADLPALASAFNPLLRWLEDDLAGQAAARGDTLRELLARGWVRLRALAATPLPQPLPELAGRHRRLYRLAPRLDLTMLGAEAWAGSDGTEGISLHGWSPQAGRWLRLSVVQTAAMRANLGWTLPLGWADEQWAGLSLGTLSTARLTLTEAWLSDDGHLSARAGTLAEIIETGDTVDIPAPPAADARAAAGICVDSLSDELLTPAAQPVLIGPLHGETPQFDTASQLWTQTVRDAGGGTLRLQMAATDSHSRTAIGSLDRWWQQGRRWTQVFGWLAQHDGIMTVRPISVWTDSEGTWRHPTLR